MNNRSGPYKLYNVYCDAVVGSTDVIYAWPHFFLQYFHWQGMIFFVLSQLKYLATFNLLQNITYLRSEGLSSQKCSYCHSPNSQIKDQDKSTQTQMNRKFIGICISMYITSQLLRYIQFISTKQRKYKACQCGDYQH